ncbi:hypothetical protein CPC08DRAFT_706709, partial [Agrocybe pediades]
MDYCFDIKLKEIPRKSELHSPALVWFTSACVAVDHDNTVALCSDRSHRNDHGVKLLFWDRFLTKFESNILLSDLNSRKDLQAFVQVRGLPLNRSGPASSTYPRNVKGAPSDEPDGHMHAFDSATYELDTMRKKDSMKCGIEISKVVESRQ